VEPYTEIADLLLKHLKRELTPGEAANLTAWVERSDKNRQFFAAINNTPEMEADVRAYKEGQQIDLDAAWEKINSYDWAEEQPRHITSMRWWRYAAAAVVLLAVSVTVYYFYRHSGNPVPVPTLASTLQSDVRPISTHAFLTLDNGATIMLDSLTSGYVATQGGMKVERKDNGGLQYSADGKLTTDKVLYNKVMVPKGSDVMYLQLSDETKVWLNAESSIRYPVVFNEEERKVEITGEVYFEVTSLSLTSSSINNKSGEAERGKGKRPFIVSKGNMSVIVLGTKFNVNAYDDEGNVKVTLLEGSVKVQSEANGKQVERVITPGQQAVLNRANINILSDVDIEQVIAWKQGKFVFNDTDLDEIMRQIQRWYDVEVTYEGDIKSQGITFTGRISRYNNASKVLDLLQTTGQVDFTINGKRVIVKSTTNPSRD
jgi:ferric-dicitrate binding protein FerR (iron transport regulator)